MISLFSYDMTFSKAFTVNIPKFGTPHATTGVLETQAPLEVLLVFCGDKRTVEKDLDDSIEGLTGKFIQRIDYSRT